MSHKVKEKWFWTWLVLITAPKSRLNYQRAKVEVWKNLVILRAATAGQAVSKAFRIGASEEGDCGGTLRLHGRPAITKFLGLEDIGLIHEELVDGAEILWQLRKYHQKTARKLVKPRKKLLASLQKELSSLTN